VLSHLQQRVGVAGLVVACLSIAALGTPPAGAEVTKFYNAAHSLSGSCTVKGFDPVPDPGCPGGEHPPEGPIQEPGGVATDPSGNIYVVNKNRSQGRGNFHIDIFDSEGYYLGNVPHKNARDIVVDSTGHLYVTTQYAVGAGLVRYDPIVYKPEAGEIEYGATPVVVRPGDPTYGSIEIDHTNDHLYVSAGDGSGEIGVSEYGAATDGTPNVLIDDKAGATVQFMGQMALDASRHRIYVIDAASLTGEPVIRVFDSRAPYPLLFTIDASETPAETFSEPRVALAADEATGHVFLGDVFSKHKVYEFDEDGKYLGELKRPTTLLADWTWITIDNWETSPNRGYLYLPNGFDTVGHLLAYEPAALVDPPSAESLSVGGITEEEAVARAVVNPEGGVTQWVLEVVTEEAFAGSGFDSAQVVGEGTVSPGREGVQISAPLLGLSPGTAYRVRLRLENECAPEGCPVERQVAFTTFKALPQVGSCPNQAFRVGPSAALPDCRAYELVTPANTGGARPNAPNMATSGPLFGTPPAAPDGQNLAFTIFGTLIPGLEGTGGGLSGDPYLSSRTSEGWETELIGPAGSDANTAASGGMSPEHGFVAVQAGAGNAGEGPLLPDGKITNYVRYPDGSFRLLEGSLGYDPNARVRDISANGSHILFQTSETDAVQLEPEAPPAPTVAIYDRTPDGVTHVVSLLPGEITPPDEEDAAYLGASEDGSSVAFRIDKAAPIYLRVDNAETQLVAESDTSSKFAGLSADGRYLFFIKGGDLHRYDSQSGGTLQVTEFGDVSPVNIAASGEAAYFLSGQPEAPDLYHWDGEVSNYVATVTKRDAVGDSGPASGFDGLGLWMEAILSGRPGILASRTTADGSVLLFISRADLTGFESNGKAQVFRYRAGGGALECLSCSRTGTSPTHDTTLLAYQGVNSDPVSLNPDPTGVNGFTEIPNLSSDGRRAFFETDERLLARDNDQVADVYEWEASGKGSCATPGGCLYLISSGQSARPNHLFGASESGDDVFFLTSDLLVAEDVDDTPSVYDARVGGGFPIAPELAGECLGEACQPAVAPLNDPTPNSASYRGQGNAVPRVGGKRCPKGKRKIRRAQKTRCVPRKTKTKNRSRADGRTQR
jgi:hypothetical protein